MKIDKSIVRKHLGLGAAAEVDIRDIGLVDSTREKTLSFLDDDNYLPQLVMNPNISVVLCKKALSGEIEKHGKTAIITDDPRFSFYTLYNALACKAYQKTETVVDSTAEVHPKASISAYNVSIGRAAIIEPNATVLPDVDIGDSCVVRAGAVLGCIALEIKKTSRGVISVFHDGKAIIGHDVEIGAGTCVAKGFSFRNTIIGESTKIGCLDHISHCVHIGKRCLITSNVMISGSVTIGDDVWISPSVTFTNGISIGNNAFIGIASVVTQDVPPGSRIIGVQNKEAKEKREKEQEDQVAEHRSNIDERVLKIARGVFPNERRLSMTSTRDNTFGWDSLGNMNLMMALENDMDIEFHEDDFQSMNSLEEIVRVLEKELAAI